MKLQTRKLSDLKVYANNPRNNQEAIPKLKESISRYGYKVPIIVDNDNVIVAGHTRFAALLEINEETGDYEEIAVILADDLSEQAIKEFRIVDNQVAALSEWDFTALNLELGLLEDFNYEDFGAIKGFNTDIEIFDEVQPEQVASDKVKIQIGDYKFEMDESDYHEWASWCVGQTGLSVIDYVKQRLCIDPRDRTFNGEVPPDF